MAKKYRIELFLFLMIALLIWGIILVKGGDFPVLQPKGWVALQQSYLIKISLLVMSLVVLPVFILTLYVAYKYRASNEKAKYDPKWVNSHLLEAIWWGVPFLIIIFLSVLTWKSTYQLDPYKALGSDRPPLKVQVVSLQWKWLFIYPEQGVASVNALHFPVNQPLDFEITSDAPMNSFWIPHLGGQIYSMPGMKTHLHLIANEMGDFRGCSANLSGTGFSSMVFKATATSDEEFEQWVAQAKEGESLDLRSYEKLTEPSQYHPVTLYRLEKSDLFDWIVMKPMRKE